MEKMVQWYWKNSTNNSYQYKSKRPIKANITVSDINKKHASDIYMRLI